MPCERGRLVPFARRVHHIFASTNAYYRKRVFRVRSPKGARPILQNPSIDSGAFFGGQVTNDIDVGEAADASLANSLTLGCDCLGQIYYFDAVLNNI